MPAKIDKPLEATPPLNVTKLAELYTKVGVAIHNAIVATEELGKEYESAKGRLIKMEGMNARSIELKAEVDSLNAQKTNLTEEVESIQRTLSQLKAKHFGD